jgi:hypothetical protein
MSSKSTAVVPHVISPDSVEADPLPASLPQWLRPDSAERLRRVLRCRTSIERNLKETAVDVVMVGLDLIALKKQVGHGHWADVLGKYLEPAGITERHAQRYMQVADGARKVIARQAQVDPSRLLAAPRDLPADEMDRLQDAVAEATDAKTWKELLEDFGMSRPRRRGGFHPPVELLQRWAREHGLEPDYASWLPGTQAAFREWVAAEKRRQKREADAADPHASARRRREAVDALWSPWLTQLLMAVDGTAPDWAILPAGKLRQIAAECRRFAALIDTSVGID